MIQEKRSTIRVINTGFRELKASISSGNDVFFGFPGDISESGISILLPDSEPTNLIINDILSLKIESRYFNKPFETSVKLIREDKIQYENKDYILLGLEFPKGIDIPDNLIAIDLMLND